LYAPTQIKVDLGLTRLGSIKLLIILQMK